MTVTAGYNLLLKIGDGGAPVESFFTVGGVDRHRLQVRNRFAQSRPVSPNAWGKPKPDSGERLARFELSGIVTDAATEEWLAHAALQGTSRRFRMEQDGGSAWAGEFLISDYTRTATQDDVVRYSVVLESVGEVAVG